MSNYSRKAFRRQSFAVEASMLKTFVAWYAEELNLEMEHRLIADDPEALRRVQQKLDLADAVWKSWATSNGGSVIAIGNGSGVLEIPPGKLGAIPALQRQYGEALGSRVCIGVGTKLSEAQRALRVAKMRGGDEIVLYTQAVDEELDEAQRPKDSLQSILGEAKTDEDAVKKALAENPSQGGGGFGGFARGGNAVAPMPPMQEASEHSQAEAAAAEASSAASAAPPPPEMTHAAGDLEDAFHKLAGQQDQKDAQDAQAAQSDKAAIKSAIVAVLQKVRGQSAVLGQLKQQAPDAYNAVVGLVQGVIAMAHSLEEAVGPQQAMQKSDDDDKGSAFKNSDTGEVIVTGPFHDIEQVPDEWEGKTVEGYVDDDGTFMTRAEAAERLEKAEEHPLDRDVRILREGGIPASKKQIGDGWPAYLHVADGADEDISGVSFRDPRTPSRVALIHRSTKGPGWQASFFDEKGPLSDSQHRTLAEAIRETRHSAMSVEKVWRRGQDLEKSKLPMPETKTHNNLELPVGTVKQGGPSANAHGDVGHVKVQHGDGKTSWIQARAGQNTVVADRHGQPILGHAGHPISSRNPIGR